MVGAWCYTYDQDRRVATQNFSTTQTNCSSGTQYTYTYNPAGRLSNFQAGTSSSGEIKYDRDGNRSPVTFAGAAKE